MKKAQQFEVGDKVQSKYRARFHGIVLGVEWTQYNGGNYPLYFVVPLLTVDGRPQRKRHCRRLSGYWLEKSDMEMEWPKNAKDLYTKRA